MMECAVDVGQIYQCRDNAPLYDMDRGYFVTLSRDKHEGGNEYWAVASFWSDDGSITMGAPIKHLTDDEVLACGFMIKRLDDLIHEYAEDKMNPFRVKRAI